jgi:hypothetical protein
VSAYKKIECDIVDKDSLLEALELLDLNAKVHENPINLKGYRGDTRNEKANIIIDKTQVNKFTGASNDIGFLWNDASNKYEFIVSEYDQRFKMDQRIIQAYVKVVLEKALKKNGFKIKVNIDESILKRKIMSDLEITARKIV